MEYNKPLTPFKMQVLQNFPYIEADFDALTNYQLLCKIVEYLNKTIDSQNEVIFDVGQLHSAFLDLKNFIEDYFENLDVQDEINNKLDNMAEDGTLYDLINRFVQPKIDSQNDRIELLEDEISAMASGSPAGVYSTIASLQQADPDHSRIYLVEADGNWYYFNNATNQWKNGGVYQATGIGLNEVDYTNFNNTTKNAVKIRVPEFTTSSGYVDTSGRTQSNVGYLHTSGITLHKNETIYFKAKASLNSTGQGNVSVLSLYNEKQGGVKIPLIINDSENTKYYSFTSNNNEDIVVHISSDKNTLNDVFIYENIKENIKDLNESIVNIPRNFTFNGFINYSNGVLTEHANYKSTDFIKVYAGYKLKQKNYYNFVLSLGNSGIAFYDKNKHYISGIQYPVQKELEITIPNNAMYMRYSVQVNTVIESFRYINIIDKIIDKSVELKDYYNTSMFSSIGVVGDSYANGNFGNNAQATTDSEHLNQSWPQVLGRITGCNVSNFTLGGLSTRTWLTNQQRGLTKLLSESKKDLYILALERNDYNIEYRGETGYLGSINDITSHTLGNYPDSFYGNYATIIERIQAYSPNSKIIMMSGDYLPTNELGTNYNNAVKEIAEHYNIPCIVQLDNDYFSTDYYRKNWPAGGHPGPLQYSGMAKAIITMIDECLENNINYFKYTGSNIQ